MSAPVFDLQGPVPSGTIAIEASAGTGKTFALATLATRFVAEGGVAASELLVVTFTRAAAAELRDRIRSRMVGAVRCLAGVQPAPPDDELVASLLAGNDAERQPRLRHLQRAVADFDSATVTTIHGFALQALSGFEVPGMRPGARVVGDADDDLRAVCVDVLAAESISHDRALDDLAPLPGASSLHDPVKALTHSPDLTLVPNLTDPDVPPELQIRLELIDRAIREFRHRRRLAGVVTFSDLVENLRSALVGPDGDRFIDAIRRRYRVALVDEFQDTDAAQWEIFHRLFGTTTGSVVSREPLPLVLVGDPKQSIYAFRGADIATYLRATDASTGVEAASLGTNWRADKRMIDALGVMFDGATFGDDRIHFTPVDVAPAHKETSIRDATGAALPAIVIRTALHAELPRTRQRGEIAVAGARAAIFVDLAEEVHSLIGATSIPADPDHPEAGDRPVRADDIAVLVRTSDQADEAHRALIERGVPAVVARGPSVLESAAATQWRWLIEALIRPSDVRRARAFALSWFCGWDADRLVAASDREVAELQARLHDWVEMLSAAGTAAGVHRILSDTGVAARVLARPDGERNLTDLLHVGELLQRGSPLRAPGAAALLDVLDAGGEAGSDTEDADEVAARRVESDAAAVQIMTIWVAKGLEFPIVAVPTLWDAAKDASVIQTDPDTRARIYDLGQKPPWPDTAAAARRKDRAWLDHSGEMLRLTYVALTRARHHALLWWTAPPSTAKSPLTRLLFARDADQRIDEEAWRAPKVTVPSIGEVGARLNMLAERSDGTIAIVEQPPRSAVTPRIDPHERSDGDTTAPTPVAASLGRSLDRDRHRWSFTLITAQLHGADSAERDRLDGTDGDGGASDESQSGGPSATVTADPGADVVDPDGLPAGAAFGSLVHEVLEQLDFTDSDLRDSAERIALELALRQPRVLPPADVPRLAEALHAALATPFGQTFEGLRLNDLSLADRLNEVAFDLRLAGGGAAATLAEVATVVLDHLPPDDPLVPWATSLRDGHGPRGLAGHLTGSVDLVLRHRRVGSAERYVVVDYKTNRLHSYGRDHLVAAMAAHHYPLQALLYQVALHRYLRWRLADYNPGSHLGGVAYLFLRGMRGPSTSQHDGHVDGVFDWAVPPALVVQLSELLDGRRSEGSSR